MFDSKYSKVLTVILIIVIIAIVALLGFLAFDYYQNYIITKETSEFVEAFEGDKISTEGNTTNNALKDAYVETGLLVRVPLFIEQGEKILVTTSDGKYSSRA